jgi:threonine dehydrogenase-like Zn-dependent dehydrogenase
VFQEAIKITRGGGGLGIIGVYVPETPTNPAPGLEHVTPFVQLPIGMLMFKEIQIRSGLVDFMTSIPALVNLVLNGRARPGFIFSAEADLEDAPRAYRKFARREEVRILLKPEQDVHRARAGPGMVGNRPPSGTYDMKRY